LTIGYYLRGIFSVSQRNCARLKLGFRSLYERYAQVFAYFASEVVIDLLHASIKAVANNVGASSS